MTVTGCGYIELLQKSNRVFCYLFGSQMRLMHKLVYIVSVVELLFKAEAQCFNIAVAVEACYLSPKPPSRIPSSRVITTLWFFLRSSSISLSIPVI